ncbi:MAG: hypothetical protein GSR73_06140 [Desulfurococcales archaeon]|nr:hypothetical protein [Desulfurococcales archaeon]
MPLENCPGRWKVAIEAVKGRVRKHWPQALERLEEAKALEEALNHDREMIYRLMREPVIARTPLGPVRRYRLSTPGGWLRLLFRCKGLHNSIHGY